MNKRYPYLKAFILCINAMLIFNSATLAQAPNYQWAQRSGGSSDDESLSVTTDANGNIIATGYFQSSTITFGTTTLTNAGGGYTDMFIVKYDNSGNVLWAQSAGGESWEFGRSVTTDSSGNLLVTGYFSSSSITFGSTTLTSANSGWSNMFLVKYDINGNVLLAKSVGGISSGNSVASDASGNILVTGTFYGSSISFGSYTFPNAGSSTYDMFLVKYDAGGNVLWAKSAGGTSADYANSVTSDAIGNVIIAGSFQSSTISFSSYTLINAGGSAEDIFLTKYDASGNVLWAKSAGGGSSNDGCNSVSFDVIGNVYITGYFQGTTDFDPSAGTANLTPVGAYDIFIAKYDANGIYLWAKNIGSTSSDKGHRMTVDVFGNAYISGFFSGTADFDPSAGTANLTPVGSDDIFFAKYDQNGNYLWANSIGSTNTDYGFGQALDVSDNVFISGSFNGTADFDVSTGTANLTPVGGADIFLAKYSQPTPPTLTSSNMPTPGNAMIFAVDTAPSSVSPGNYGANQSWNLTNIQLKKPDSVYFSAPNTLAGYNNFTGSNLGIGVPNDSSSYFVNSNSSSYKMLGAYTNFGYGYMPIAFTPWQTWLNFPSTYQSAFNENYSFQIQYYYGQAGIDSIRNTSNKNASSLIDGWGTITTPAHSNLNCLRQKIIVTSIDSAFVQMAGNWSFAGPPSYDTSHFYRWWSDSLKFHVAEIITNKNDSVTEARYQNLMFTCNLSATANATNVSCAGGNNGTATAIATGYIPVKRTVQVASNNFSPASFTAFIGDTIEWVLVNGSHTSTSTLVPSGASIWDAPITTASPSFTYIVTTPGTYEYICTPHGFIGSFTVSSPYSYLWSNGSTNAQISNLIAQVYNVTVSDVNNCTATATATIAVDSLGSWTQKTNFGGTARYLAVGFSIGTKGYIGTGYDGTAKQDFWEWDQSTNVWTQKADFGGGIRYAAVGFSIGTKGYIGTGDDGTARKQDFWEWNQGTNVWTQKANFGGTARGNAAGFSIGTKGYIGVGNDVGAGGDKQDFWEWDQSADTWTEKANFTGGARQTGVGFSIGSKGYIGLGNNYGSSIYKTDFWEYNSGSNTWTSKANFGGTARYACVGFAIGDKGYIGTGQTNTCSEFENDFWEWDPVANTWTMKASVSSSDRARAIGFSIGNKGYIGTGQFAGCTTNANDFWEYTPACIECNITASISKTDVSCNGGNNGTATVTATSGTSPYTYAWSNGATTATAINLTAGNYSVTVTDANNCSVFLTSSIFQPGTLSNSVSTTSVSCNGGSNGSACIVSYGGTSPYIYQWNNGGTGSCQNNVPAGIYVVTVTDANGCQATATAQISEPSAPLSLSVNVTNASCNGCNDGAAYSVENGGTPPYSFLWSTGATTEDIFGLSAGTYGVTVTDTNGCTANVPVFISQPMQANINFTNDTTNVCAPYTVNFTNLSTGNYNFYWNVRNDFSDTTINADSLSFLFESGGYYQVELCAFDSMGNNAGCAIHDVNIYGFSMQMLASSACPGDAVGFQVNQNNNGNGGNGGNGYTWNFGDGTTGSSGGDKNFHTYDSTGAYTITVIGDHPQCGPDTLSTILVISDTVMPTVYYFTNNWNSCPNDNITFFPYNASGVYTWNFGDGSPLVSNQLFETDHSFPDTGTYIVTVSVTNSCGYSDSYSDTISIQNNIGFSNQNLNNYQISPNPVCPGDGVEFRYEYPDNFETYVWNFGDGVTDTNHLTSFHAYSTAGNYIASITIINGCGYDTTLYDTVSVQNNVPVNPGDYGFIPVPLTSCPGDSILFIAENGAQDYMWYFGDGDSAVPFGIGTGDMNGIMHAFSDTGSYYASLTITNGCGNSLTDTFPLPVVISNNAVPSSNLMFGESIGTLNDAGINGVQPVCDPISFISLTGGSLFHWNFGDGSPMVTTSNVIVTHTYLSSGAYSITMIAENNCGNSATFSIQIYVGGVCPSPDITFTSNNPTCSNSNNGSILVNASDGTAPYAYLWSNGKTTALNGNLLAGAYSVTVTDANGQTAIGSVTLTAPAPIVLNISSNPSSCGSSTGLASITASGGQTPYTYLWNNGQTNQIASGLAPGQYSVTVTASNGCKAVGSTTVNASSGFSATFTGTNVTCNGAGNGTASINASGGTTPYTYSWSTGSTAASLSGLSAGTYNATVTDNTGCSINGSVQISQPPVMGVTLNGTNATTCGGSNGSISSLVIGGSSPYSYLWSTGATSNSLSGLSTGIYSLTVTDANGCTKSKGIQITAPSNSILTITKSNVTCNGTATGTASVTASGGTSPYQYLWTNNSTSATATGLTAGAYTVTVVDSAGCASTASVLITQPPALSVNTNATPAACGDSTGNAAAIANGGVPPYSFQWTNGDKTNAADSLPAGQYIVTVTDSNSCSAFVSVQVNDQGAPNITLLNVNSISCNGGNDGSINIAVTGAGTPYIYQWSNGSTQQDINNLVSGPYEVTVSNANGCIAVESISITQPEAIALTASATLATCGNADGTASVAVIGGASPYAFDWSTGDTTAQISSASGGQIYTATVTDANGCMQTASAAVGEEGGPEITLDSVTEANCAGTGSIYVSISDGVQPYTYLWNDGSATEDLISVLTGNYGLVVTDANGCTGAISTQIINTEIITDPICLLTVDTNTGTNKIVWQKSFGSGISAYKIYRESSIAGLYQLAGTIPFDSLSVFTDSAANPLIHSWRYKLAAVDSCGNESILSGEHKTIHLTVNLGLSNTINLIWDHYNGFQYGTYYIWRYKPNTGWVLKDSLASTLTSWTDFTPPTLYGLRYFVEIKHPDGCFATKSVENHNSSRSNKSYPLAPPATNLAGSANSSNENGSCNGSATVTASGGVSPYTYAWDNGENSATIDSLCAGTYNCTITDVDGDTAVVTVTILLVNVTDIGADKIITVIYPNPNKGKFTLQCNTENKNCLNGTILISNMLGELVYQSKLSNTKSVEIDLSQAGSGIYFLRLFTEKGNTAPVKIVVE